MQEWLHSLRGWASFARAPEGLAPLGNSPPAQAHPEDTDLDAADVRGYCNSYTCVCCGQRAWVTDDHGSRCPQPRTVPVYPKQQE